MQTENTNKIEKRIFLNVGQAAWRIRKGDFKIYCPSARAENHITLGIRKQVDEISDALDFAFEHVRQELSQHEYDQ
jgi:hypothetical protein